MSRRERVNPFEQGSAERVLFDRYRRASVLLRLQSAPNYSPGQRHKATATRLTDTPMHSGRLGMVTRFQGKKSLPKPGS